MTTMDYEEEENPSRSRNARRSGGSTSSSSRRSGSSRSAASSILGGMSTAGILDIVERLGLVDMVVDRVKGRLEEVDVDDLIDDVGDYLKRNPEVLVVSLGAVTIAAGALVYLNKRNDKPERAERATPASAQPRPKQGGNRQR